MSWKWSRNEMNPGEGNCLWSYWWEDKNGGERKVTQRLHRAGVHVKRCYSPVLFVLLIFKLLNCHFFFVWNCIETPLLSTYAQLHQKSLEKRFATGACDRPANPEKCAKNKCPFGFPNFLLGSYISNMSGSSQDVNFHLNFGLWEQCWDLVCHGLNFQIF